jgi:polysaccharide export outer membrane protein
MGNDNSCFPKRNGAILGWLPSLFLCNACLACLGLFTTMRFLFFAGSILSALLIGFPAAGSAQAAASGPVLTAPPNPPSDGPTGLPANTALVQNGASPATSPAYRIGPDDSLQITVWKEPSLSGTFLVRPDGMISLVLLGDVRAAGVTPMHLASDITERLKKFLQDPLVAVTVQQANSQKVYILGEVQHVGPLEMSTDMSPLQAIAAAGGLTPYANKGKIYILRGPAGKQQKIPFNYKKALKGVPNSSPQLMAGDTIVVP